MSIFPAKIICLTEESAEFLFAINEDYRIIGVSAYAERPPQVKNIEVVCAFTGGNAKKMASLEADLIIGYSDIQKDLARDLIGLGQNVFISNHRSIAEIKEYLRMLGRLVDKNLETKAVIEKIDQNLERAKAFALKLKKKPQIYIEEWDSPMISGIHWFVEIVQLCGASVLFADKALNKMAKDRIVVPSDFKDLEIDMILACWCGKKVDRSSFHQRSELAHTKAIKTNNIKELDPAIFLQPGMAPLLDGIDQVIEIISDWSGI